MRQKQVLVEHSQSHRADIRIQRCATNSSDSVAMTDDCSGLHHRVFTFGSRLQASTRDGAESLATASLAVLCWTRADTV